MIGAFRLEEIEGIKMLGSSDTSVVAFTSDVFNIYSLSDRMNKMGWNLNTLQSPAAYARCFFLMFLQME